MKKKELYFIAAVLLAAIALWAVIRLLPKSSGDAIRITVDGELLGTYSLDKDQTIPIGDTNVCEIKDGKAHMLEADCPDQLCVMMGDIDGQGGDMIVCLPNRVIIEGESGDKEEPSGPQVDAVSGR